MIDKNRKSLLKQALIVSIFVFGTLFVLGISILSVISKFDVIIQRPNLVLVLFIVGILLITYPIACLIVLLYKNKSPVYISTHAPSLFILCFLISAFLFSLDKNVFIKIEVARSLTNLEWGVFGITVAILAIWVVFITKNPESKSVKYQKISDVEFTYFLSLDLITIGTNLLFLALATSSSYLIKEEKFDAAAQTFVLFSFYLSLYSVLTVMIQMFVPLIQKRYFIKKKHDKKRSKRKAKRD